MVGGDGLFKYVPVLYFTIMVRSGGFFGYEKEKSNKRRGKVKKVTIMDTK